MAFVLLPGVCMLIVVSVYLLGRIAPDTFLQDVRYILQDGSHSATVAEKIALNVDSFFTLLFWTSIYLVLAFIIYKLVKGTDYLLILIGVVVTGQLFIWIFGDKYPNYPLVEYFIIPIAVLLYGCRAKKDRFQDLILWIAMPVAAFLSICLFTNHPFLVSAPFLAYGVVSMVACCKDRFEWRRLLPYWLLIVCFGRLFMIRTTGGVHYTIFDDLSMIRKGPAAGIIADDSACIRYREEYELIKNTIPGGSSVFCMGYNNDIFLFDEYEVSSPSVICTPTYNEITLAYFERNTEKNPDYIVCEKAFLEAEAELFGEEYQEIAQNDYIVIYMTMAEGKG